jgi:hypothetical protein
MSISESTVKRRRKEMALHGSGSTMKTIDPIEAEQLVLKALDKDPSKRSGIRTIHQRIAFDSGTHLSRCVRSTLGLRWISNTPSFVFFQRFHK